MNNEKPSWGKVIGVFFLCGCLTIGICTIASAVLVSGMGGSGYSRGGLLATATAFGCAAYYRSTGNLKNATLAAVVIGAVLGVLAVQLSLMVAGW